ncbi:hypothetical protein GYMLUDRAFT_49046 [Collybiopsis luxurians FD-317 M1]|uniref:Uncharacterized protein n=1 Tax=Collybiopsis luxurians FD-317 M1 TaxID=944289 RepID=A0A0D0C7R5_9AGAR|nr:hypothetical protein GYMLUDRAFT_49046 [Collybiopsis luxurians FD-317 M1]
MPPKKTRASNKKIVCVRSGCQFPYDGKDAFDHSKLYHSKNHTLNFHGKSVEVERRSDGKMQCPCNSDLRVRYDWQKVLAMCRQATHPAPNNSRWRDIEPQISVLTLSSLEQDSASTSGQQNAVGATYHIGPHASYPTANNHTLDSSMTAGTDVEGSRRIDQDYIEDSCEYLV